MDKSALINKIMSDLIDYFEPEQLRTIRAVIILRLKNVRVEEEKHELVIYDETSDIAAYKQYFVSKKIQGLSDGSLEQYRYTIDHFMRYTRKAFGEITTNDIRLYLANREMVNGLANQSMLRERGILVRFFTWLHAEEYIAKNPAARVERIKKETRIKEAFSDIEIERLRAATITTKEAAVIETLLSTGCRVSELCMLHSSNLDRDKQRLSIIGKGNKERYVYLNARAQVALVAYWYDANIKEGYLFSGRRKGSPMTTSGIQKLLKRVAERAGVGNVHPHRFRRTAATMALRRGMSLEVIMQFLGHCQMDTTLGYARISKDELEHQHRQFLN